MITKSNKIAQFWETKSGEFLTTLRVGPRTNDAHPSSDAILDLLIRTVRLCSLFFSGAHFVAQPERVAGALLHRLELERDGLVGRQLHAVEVDSLRGDRRCQVLPGG